MLETQFIETVKVCSPEDYLVMYVNKFDNETLDNVVNLSKNISQTYPALNYIFVSNYDAMETDVLSLEKSIEVLEKKLEEMKKAKEYKEMCAKAEENASIKFSELGGNDTIDEREQEEFYNELLEQEEFYEELLKQDHTKKELDS